MNDLEREQKLHQAVKEKIAQRWTITYGITYNPDAKCCCPLGALITDPSKWTGSYLQIAREYLEVGFPNTSWASNFVSGFESNNIGGGESYEMGKRFRKEYVDKV